MCELTGRINSSSALWKSKCYARPPQTLGFQMPRPPLRAALGIFRPVLLVVRSIRFQPEGWRIRLWDSVVALGVFYSILFLPLAVVFVQARWSGHRTLDSCIDSMLMIDVVVRLRTSYNDRGYEVTDQKLIAYQYLRTWLVFDLLSSIPFSSFWGNGEPLRQDVTAVSVAVSSVEWLSLLRLLSVGRLVRTLSWIFAMRFIRRHELLATLLKVGCLLFFYCLIAHYLGLGWYVIAVRPVEADANFDNVHDWYWLDSQGFSDTYITGVRYTCAVYWALAVMSNLKGHGAHETRQCLYHDPLIVNPLGERTYTIFAFILGASFFSFIYGNIAQFVQAYYRPGAIHDKRMADADAIAHFYSVTPELHVREQGSSPKPSRKPKLGSLTDGGSVLRAWCVQIRIAKPGVF